MSTVKKTVTTCLLWFTLAVGWSNPGVPVAGMGATASGARLEARMGNPIPIEEAIRIAAESAEQWRPGAEILRGFNRSTHEERVTIPPPGVDGKRRAWAFEFRDPATDDFVIVGVWDGKVIGVEPAGTDTKQGFDPGLIHVKGIWLADEAKRVGIHPGTGALAGYQFRLAYEHAYRKYTVSVIGIDDRGRGRILTVDPVTGDILFVG